MPRGCFPAIAQEREIGSQYHCIGLQRDCVAFVGRVMVCLTFQFDHEEDCGVVLLKLEIIRSLMVSNHIAIQIQNDLPELSFIRLLPVNSKACFGDCKSSTGHFWPKRLWKFDGTTGAYLIDWFRLVWFNRIVFVLFVVGCS